MSSKTQIDDASKTCPKCLIQEGFCCDVFIQLLTPQMTATVQDCLCHTDPPSHCSISYSIIHTINYYSVLFSFCKTESPRSFEIVSSCTLYKVSGYISPQKTVTLCQSLQFPHSTHHSYQSGITTSKQNSHMLSQLGV